MFKSQINNVKQAILHISKTDVVLIYSACLHTEMLYSTCYAQRMENVEKEKKNIKKKVRTTAGSDYKYMGRVQNLSISNSFAFGVCIIN